MMPINCGRVAVATVQGRVTLVQAAREHSASDAYLDVHTYTPFGAGVFIASEVPAARIASNALLTIFPEGDTVRSPESGMLELPSQAFDEFLELSFSSQRKHENMWKMLKARVHLAH